MFPLFAPDKEEYTEKEEDTYIAPQTSQFEEHYEQIMLSREGNTKEAGTKEKTRETPVSTNVDKSTSSSTMTIRGKGKKKDTPDNTNSGPSTQTSKSVGSQAGKATREGKGGKDVKKRGGI